MKRILSVVLSLTCLLGLSACGSKPSAQSPYETSLVGKLSEAGVFSEPLEELDADTAFMIYGLEASGLSQEDLTDCTVLRSSGGTCEEAAVLVLTDKDKATAAKGALDTYVQNQIEANRDYRPDDIPKLEKALVSQRENTLLLVVANDPDAVQPVVEG